MLKMSTYTPRNSQRVRIGVLGHTNFSGNPKKNGCNFLSIFISNQPLTK